MDVGGDVEEHYGQARAFIRLLMQDGRRCELVFMRWLLEQNVEMSDILASEYGAIPMMWAPLPGQPAASAQPWYGIMELSSVVRREYVAQDYRCPFDESRFHVSPFKWAS